MPTYDFRCPNGHNFEHFFRTMSAATQTLICPTCGSVAERRMSGGAGLVFKGSGFYITDYGKDGKGGGGKAQGESGPQSDAKAESAGGKEKGGAAESGSSSTKSDGAGAGESKSSPSTGSDSSGKKE